MNTFDVSRRVHFDEERHIMEVDFKDLVFETSADIKSVYGSIEKLLDDRQKKWFFVVNYQNTKINPDAWFQHAVSGGRLNERFSLGTVRINPDEPTREALSARQQSGEDFNPNAVSTRTDALARVEELKRGQTTATL